MGIVGVNTGSPNHPRVPFDGLKDSGIGVESGYGGLGNGKAAGREKG